MPHHPLIATVVIGLVLAFALGLLMHRIRVSPLIGYLLAGVALGPFTPGFVADQSIAQELAELGVILLMFGVGLHFSLDDLLAVRGIAIPGAIAQIAVATGLGVALASALGWPIESGLVFGLALSVASTVVLLRALQERRLIETMRGRVAVGWLIVEDLVMVLTLVLLPVLAGLTRHAGGGPAALAIPLVVTLGKVAAFAAVMLIIGRRLIPWLLHYVAHTGSRELFRLAVFSVALGAAYGAAELFGVSFALGAFFAGMILSESALSQRAAQEALPLRDAFAVLFFVSVGMLFDPRIVLQEPGPLVAVLLIVVVGKSAAAYLIVRLFGHPTATALTISASLAQIGEFSFILAGLGVSLSLLPERGRDLVLAGAILSILLNPVLFAALDWWEARQQRQPSEAPAPVVPETSAREPIVATSLTGHVVLVGHGRVGSYIGAVLKAQATPLFVIENDGDLVAALREQGTEAVAGNAADRELIGAANLAVARCLLVAIPDAFEGGQVVGQARQAHPELHIVARAHSQDEIEHLRRHGATQVIMGEHEIAKAMLAEVATAKPASGVVRKTPA
jgi:CPA2 family monovalent cation:H+ antiporter-2